MSSEGENEPGPRIEPEPADTVQRVLEDPPEAAQERANMARAEAILS